MKTVINILSVIICLLLLLVIFFQNNIQLILGEWSVYLKIFSLPIALIVLFYWLFRFRKEINDRLLIKEKIDSWILSIKEKYPDWDSSKYFRYLTIMLFSVFILGFIVFFPNPKRVERRVNIFTKGISENFKKSLETKADFYEYTGKYNLAITHYQFLQQKYYSEDVNKNSSNLNINYSNFFNTNSHILEKLDQTREKMKTSEYLFRRFVENENNTKEREGLKLLIFASVLNPGDKNIENALKAYYKNLLINSTRCRNIIKNSWTSSSGQQPDLEKLGASHWYLFDHRLFDHFSPDQIADYKSRMLQELTREQKAVEYLNENDKTWFQDEIRKIMEWKNNLPAKPFI